MATSKKRRGGRPPLKHGTAKRPMNLSLDPDVLSHAQAYSERHETSISQLVGDFLRALPLDDRSARLAPAVRRLHGVAKGGAPLTAHRAFLADKYGVR